MCHSGHLTFPMAATRILGVGVDVARVARFRRSYERFGERFLRKAFHAREIDEFHARSAAQQPLYLASRWAVKEAAFKAFQRYRVLFPEIYVEKRSADACSRELDAIAAQVHTALPTADASDVKALQLCFAGETAALVEQLRIEEPHVSLSHDGEYAVAVVVLQQRV